ncbi:hypothetical protein CHS0354_015249 [Potamilus streckersoni]|uniref:Uncharacterized protein n=1 Tax=Potamilus streckersoni TaxID=2493646 RepID=A0AAE0RR38_9BIVA|nr:hypothetical protein CHS0354_015249 [Potamilus streckersoni]
MVTSEFKPTREIAKQGIVVAIRKDTLHPEEDNREALDNLSLPPPSLYDPMLKTLMLKYNAQDHKFIWKFLKKSLLFNPLQLETVSVEVVIECKSYIDQIGMQRKQWAETSH